MKVHSSDHCVKSNLTQLTGLDYSTAEEWFLQNFQIDCGGPDLDTNFISFLSLFQLRWVGVKREKEKVTKSFLRLPLKVILSKKYFVLFLYEGFCKKDIKSLVQYLMFSE